MCAACIALAACSSGGAPLLLDAKRIELATRGAETHLTGSPGAVWPAGSALSAANLRGRTETRGTAAQDGSFDLTVDGTTADVFELFARRGEQRSNAVFVSRLETVAGHDDLGELTCSERKALTAELIEDAVSHADDTCTSDDDCVQPMSTPVCFTGCIDRGLSRLGAAEVIVTLESIGAGLCDAAVGDSCISDKLTPCADAYSDAAPCLNGKCAYRALDLAVGDRCEGAHGKPGTQGVLSVSFETQTLGTAPHWGPSNMGAVWIEDASGTYIKTIERWVSQLRERSLYHWQTHACTNAWPEPDAVSQASLAEPAKHHSTWDSKDLHGKVVPDGMYYLLIEVTETETAYGPLVAYAFEKGAQPIADRSLSGSEIQVRPRAMPFISPLEVVISYTPSPDAPGTRDAGASDAGDAQ